MNDETKKMLQAWRKSGLSVKEAQKLIEEEDKKVQAEKAKLAWEEFQNGLFFRNMMAFGILLVLILFFLSQLPS